MLMISNRRYVWWPDTVSPALLPEVRSAGSAKHVTDRYLLGIARRNAGRVITFDRALATAGGDDIVCLSPA
jgi:predicted nucleic acid-binding protein